MKIQGIITATVAVIMIMLIAVPLIDDASSTVRTATNNTTETFMVTDADGDVEIVKNSDNTMFTVNGQPFMQYYMMIYFATDDMVCYYTNVSTTQVMFRVMTPDLNVNATKLSVHNGNWEAFDDSGSSVASGTVNGKMMYLSNEGKYGIFSPSMSNPLFINDDSPLIGILTRTLEDSSGNTKPIITYLGGTYSNLTARCAISGTDMISPSAVSVTMTSGILQDDESIRINSPVFSITASISGTTYTSEGNILRLIAPIEYKVISENDSIIITLLELVPVLLIVALVLGIGYEIAYKRE